MENRIQTVNVIEFRTLDPSNIDGHDAWHEDKEGNKAAEARFAELVRLQKDGISDDDVQTMIEDGYCEVGEGAILLTHTC